MANPTSEPVRNMETVLEDLERRRLDIVEGGGQVRERLIRNVMPSVLVLAHAAVRRETADLDGRSEEALAIKLGANDQHFYTLPSSLKDRLGADAESSPTFQLQLTESGLAKIEAMPPFGYNTLKVMALDAHETLLRQRQDSAELYAQLETAPALNQ